MWQIIYDGMVAFLAAVGLVTVLWLTADAIFTIRERNEEHGRALHGGGHRRNHHLSK